MNKKIAIIANVEFMKVVQFQSGLIKEFSGSYDAY